MNYQLEEHLVVSEDHLDELNHVNNVIYLQWAQDIAEKHWRTVANKDIQDRFKWVVLRHEIDYKFPCKLGDHLSVKTKVTPDVLGPKWGRQVSIYNGSKLAASVLTIWCLIDAQTARPLRIPIEIEELLKNS